LTIADTYVFAFEAFLGEVDGIDGVFSVAVSVDFFEALIGDGGELHSMP